ncbi:MAG: NAD/FAD-binding protein [Rhodospirillaceae bacterium]|nr:NAD/FAD-binding protein [Rhodospirillaceae bacterium]|tara:strand:- start:279 stop:1583 length:1305 start_codon:yes stop_codon:yes gene_type:complete
MTNTKSNMSPDMLDIAVIGSGIAGISAAWLLSTRHDVQIYEQNDYVGGHSNTVNITLGNQKKCVDTGFIVFNNKTYPNLTSLFDYLGVKTKISDMSFAVSLSRLDIEYCSKGLNGFFAQRNNLLKFSHWSIIVNLLRFYKLSSIKSKSFSHFTVADFLKENSYSDSFINLHLLPMIAAIWSVPISQASDFPFSSVVNFFDNHGLLKLGNRPVWKTVIGGSRSYVKKIVQDIPKPIKLNCQIVNVIRQDNKVILIDQIGNKYTHDMVIIASHADQALNILDCPTLKEKEILGGFKYCLNKAVLHEDVNLMPKRRSVWSSWNVIDTGLEKNNLGVTYWLNNLHKFNDLPNIFLTLNPPKRIDPKMFKKSFLYSHPLLNHNAQRARKNLSIIQGKDNIWFCGSYFGYGFHEDALLSALNISEKFGIVAPWKSNGVRA